MSGKVKATERLYLTAGKDRLVRHGDPAAAFLYCSVGREVDEVEARSLGFFDLDPEPEPEPEPKRKPGRPKGSKNKPKGGGS